MPPDPSRPIVAAIDMGYGHLRAAAPLADALGVPMLRMDLPPLGDARDAWFWRRTRAVYEPLTRWSQIGLVGAPLRALLGRITAIPEGGVDLSAPTAGTRWMERAARGGAGRALAEHLRRTRAPLLSTFYAAPILAELHGAQRAIATKLLRALARPLRAGRVALALVAGRRRDVARGLRAAASSEGLAGHPAVELLEEPDTLLYLRKFNALLARTDVLWTKPSEMTFFAALGLPVIAAPPVGVHEERNLRWAMEQGALLMQGDPDRAGEWLPRWIADGTLARAAWNGFLKLPKLGLYEILD